MTDDCAFARITVPEFIYRPGPPVHYYQLPPAKPDRLQPNQLAWCAANVPGFVDLLAERADG